MALKALETGLSSARSEKVAHEHWFHRTPIKNVDRLESNFSCLQYHRMIAIERARYYCRYRSRAAQPAGGISRTYTGQPGSVEQNPVSAASGGGRNSPPM